MDCMPNISTAKPKSMLPTFCRVRSFENILSTTPAMAVAAEIFAVDSTAAQPPASMEESAIIQPVMLVPIIAPLTTARAWVSFIMPEFTKPTAITEVAEDD